MAAAGEDELSIEDIKAIKAEQDGDTLQSSTMYATKKEMTEEEKQDQLMTRGSTSRNEPSSWPAWIIWTSFSSASKATSFSS